MKNNNKIIYYYFSIYQDYEEINNKRRYGAHFYKRRQKHDQYGNRYFTSFCKRRQIFQGINCKATS